MKSLSDAALRHLRETVDRPDASPRYEVHELLGRGGMGVVYRAHDLTLDRDVALKVLAMDADTGAGGIATRLAREARVLARLEHPGIVAVHDAGTLADGRPYYVMRLVRGVSLAHHPRTGGRGELLRLFLRLCDAVAFAHARGVIHRDLKPSNIMIGEFGEALVLDWGVAKIENDRGANLTSGGESGAGDSSSAILDDDTQDGVVVGTPGYMPPELAAGGARTADRRADIFGLGAILRDLLHTDDGRVPPPLSAIITRATAPSPDDRYPHVESLADDVRRWLDGESVASYKENIFERGAREYRRNRTLILLFLAYVVVRLTILFWRHV